MLDEPIAGMNREERAEIAEIMKSLRDDGLTQLLIEHDLRIVLNTCDHIFVMNFGKKVAEGPPHARPRCRSCRRRTSEEEACRRLRSRTWSSATAQVTAVHGIDLRLEQGQVAIAARLQRRRQDVHAERPLRARSRPSAGTITFDGARHHRHSRRTRSPALGLVQVPEGRRIIGPLTVEDNLLLGAYHQRSSGRLQASC